MYSVYATVTYPLASKLSYLLSQWPGLRLIVFTTSMGTQPCRRVVVLAIFIVVTAFSVMRLDLNSKYNPNIGSTVWQIDRQPDHADQAPSSAGVEGSNANEPPTDLSFSAAAKAADLSILAAANAMNQSFPAAALAANLSFPPSVKASAKVSYKPKGTSLWIHVHAFAEGMASWRIALAELLMAAKTLNATVVEPCVRKGRLRTCGDSTFRLGQVYDLKRLRRFYPRILSYSDYQAMIAAENPVIVPMCMQNPKGNPPLTQACGNVPNVYQQQVNFHKMALQHTNGTTVIHIPYFRRDAFLHIQVEGKQLFRPEKTERMLSDYFDFKRHYYDTADNLLRLMGIANTSDFDVIHWRAELPTIQYDDCADKVLQARKVMSSNESSIEVVLMSSINGKAGMQWYKSHNQSEAIKSVNRLLDSGFHKVDQVLDKVQDMIPDMIAIPIWDQIIAQKARRFTTCTSRCRYRRNPCVACNFLGNFGQTAIDLRKKMNKSSDECWPI